MSDDPTSGRTHSDSTASRRPNDLKIDFAVFGDVPKIDLSGVISSRLAMAEVLNQTAADVTRRFAAAISPPSLNFDVSGVLASIAPQTDEFRRSIARIVTTVGLATPPRRYPSNWWGLDAPDNLELIVTMVLDEGLALAWVPPTTVLRALLAAPDARVRRRILGRRWEHIAVDAHRHLDHVSSPVGRAHAVFATKSIDALIAGHTEAAQALATSLLDTLVRNYVANWGKVTAKNQRPNLEKMTLRDALVLGGIWGSYRNYRAGDPIPSAFSRHATSHGVSRKQYSRINALIVIMHVVGVLRMMEVDGFARRT